MFTNWKQDFRASLVVFLVALPLCLGIALASNAPLAAGLYAGIIGGMIVGAVSGSPLSVSGPAAGLTVIVASAITSIGSFEAFTLAVTLSGIIQIIFGLVKFGAIGDYFPNSVIKGMLAAIGILIILKQIPHAVGLDTDFMGDESFQQPSGENTFTQILLSMDMLHPGAISVTIISLIIMMIWEKISSRKMKILHLIPGALIAVVVAILLNSVYEKYFPVFFIKDAQLVSLPFNGEVKDFFTSFNLPDWSYIKDMRIYMAAITIALVGSLESLLSIDAADKLGQDGRVTNKNRELLAQGIGNTVSGLIGGLPITAVIIRTTANVTAGANSKLSTIFHGLWLMLCILFIPALINKIPLSSLAAILFMVGYKLTKPALFKEMYLRGKNQFIPFIVTIVSILFTNLLVGILIGMAVGFYFVLRSNLHKSIVMVKEKEFYLVKFYKDVSFLQKKTLQRILGNIPQGSSVILDGSNSVFVDDDIQNLIEDFMKYGKKFGINIELKKSSLALCPLFKG